MTKEYLEIELDAETREEVEALAEESNVKPFEMCVILLQEELFSFSAAQSLHG